MARPKKHVYAFRTELEYSYDIIKMVSSVVRVDGDTQINPEFNSFRVPADRDFADLQIMAYAEKYNDSLSLSGLRFTPTDIRDAKHAQNIGRTLTKGEKGWRKLDEQLGYLTGGDYAGMVIRYAQIFDITGGYYVRSTKQERERSGEFYRRTDGAGLQYWVKERRREISEGFVLD